MENTIIAIGDNIKGQSLIVCKGDGKLEKLNELQEQHLHKVRNFWATPQARDYRSPDKEESGNFQRKQAEGYTIDLNSQVKMKWPTPTVSDIFTGNLKSSQQKEGSMHSVNLSQAVKMWPSPASRDYKGANSKGHLIKESENRNHLDQLPNAVLLYGQQDQEKSNTDGKNPVLNPHWVASLMGTTSEKIFFVHSEIA